MLHVRGVVPTRSKKDQVAVNQLQEEKGETFPQTSFSISRINIQQYLSRVKVKFLLDDIKYDTYLVYEMQTLFV